MTKTNRFAAGIENIKKPVQTLPENIINYDNNKKYNKNSNSNSNNEFNNESNVNDINNFNNKSNLDYNLKNNNSNILDAVLKKNKKPEYHNHSFYLSDLIYAKLNEASRLYNKSKSELVEIILNEGLKEILDQPAE